MRYRLGSGFGWFSFLYLLFLAVSLTRYGGPVRGLRWIVLAGVMGLCLAAGGLRPPREFRWALPVYLICTGTSLLTAKSPLFSSARWLAHVAMIWGLVVGGTRCLTTENLEDLLALLRRILLVITALGLIMPGYDGPHFAGLMSDSNTMGHLGALAAILYFHEYLGSPKKVSQRLVPAAICGLCALMVWRTSARSSALALLLGMAILLTGQQQKNLQRGTVALVLLVIATIIAPTLPSTLLAFFRKGHQGPLTFERIFASRTPVWEAAFAAFQERPFLGYGFGADQGVATDWSGRLSAVGMVSRDAVSDLLFVLEGTGLVGLLGYVFLMKACVIRRPSFRHVGRWLRSNIEHKEARTWRLWLLCYSLVLSMLVLFQLDSTAFSPGSLFSGAFWVAVMGCSLSELSARHSTAKARLSHENEQLAGARDTAPQPQSH